MHRSDGLPPLSADRSVWPERQATGVASGLFDEEIHNGLELQAFDYSKVSCATLLGANGLVIMLTGAPATVTRLRERHKIEEKCAVLDSVRRLLFLGYDVCDEWLTSGLSNFGVWADHMPRLERYANQINERGLFSDHCMADDLAITLTAMFPEHAPFHRIGLSAVHHELI